MAHRAQHYVLCGTSHGASKASKTGLFVGGSFSGKLNRNDGEIQCSGGPITKWKVVEITGNYRLIWQALP